MMEDRCEVNFLSIFLLSSSPGLHLMESKAEGLEIWSIANANTDLAE